ncbi:hypothetical protein [Aliarcobacter cryaerophilus]|uniref:hypothetical protein n=1 Tax=Aliarcobacter cryaerophilus TaxID=28198 RepID=UPI003DA695B7
MNKILCQVEYCFKEYIKQIFDIYYKSIFSEKGNLHFQIQSLLLKRLSLSNRILEYGWDILEINIIDKYSEVTKKDTLFLFKKVKNIEIGQNY